MNVLEIETALQNFTGTEGYHKLGTSSIVVATDGVAFLAKEANAYWFTDIISSYQPIISRSVQYTALWDFQVWKLTRNKTTNGAKVVCYDGNDNAVFSQRIPYTDFPLQEITIWVEPQDKYMVMYLPSEH
jgi:hypothetical protein